MKEDILQFYNYDTRMQNVVMFYKNNINQIP